MKNQYDVVISGAGVAGCATAILLGKQGFDVLLVEQKSEIDKYKTLCTHFIQPFSIPILREIGAEELLEPQNSVKTKAAFYTVAGKIDPDGTYVSDEDQQTAYAYNLERRVMDPVLRRLAEQAGVTLVLNTQLIGLQKQGSGYLVELSDKNGQHNVECQLMVAADGRQSKVARLVDNPTKKYPNDRAAYFCYAHGVDAPANQRSVFALKDQEMSFLYPLPQNRTLLSVYITKERAQLWRKGDMNENLVSFFSDQDYMPNMDEVQIDSRIYGYVEYENTVRLPAYENVAFVGDTSCSLDPMSGVGCSFALKSAKLLTDAIKNTAYRKEIDVREALANYEDEFELFFPAHIQGIVADSLVSDNPEAAAQTYQTIVGDEKLQRKYIDLTGRLITPAKFQQAYLMASAKRMSQEKKARRAAQQAAQAAVA